LQPVDIAVKKNYGAAIANPQCSKSFEFQLQATENNEKLIDSYTGVDFSVLYKIICTAKLSNGKNIKG
jgi:hypothetical protein